MKQFNYVIKDPAGVHARPAGVIVQEAKKYQSACIIKANGKQADMKRIFGIMGLCIKAGQEVVVEVNGADEEAAAKGIEAALKANL